MKKVLTLVAIIAFAAAFTSCTENERAKSFGGTMRVDIKKGDRLVEATWKESQLWYLTTKADSGHAPKVYTFQEESSFGMMEGTVIFKEQ